MPIVHVNAKGKIYYLHQGNTKTGKPKYHFAMKSEGNLAESIPEGFEIYENPNAQVFLRRIPPKIITDEERQIVEDGMRKYGSVQDYKIDVKGKAIFVYTAVQDIEALMAIIQDGPTSQDEKTRVMATLRQEIQYTSDMQFVLVDEVKRTFATQRYCYLGSVDDWIPVGPSWQVTKPGQAVCETSGQGVLCDPQIRWRQRTRDSRSYTERTFSWRTLKNSS